MVDIPQDGIDPRRRGPATWNRHVSNTTLGRQRLQIQVADDGSEPRRPDQVLVVARRTDYGESWTVARTKPFKCER